jgi:hypothetical protein
LFGFTKNLKDIKPSFSLLEYWKTEQLCDVLSSAAEGFGNSSKIGAKLLKSLVL